MLAGDAGSVSAHRREMGDRSRSQPCPVRRPQATAPTDAGPVHVDLRAPRDFRRPARFVPRTGGRHRLDRVRLGGLRPTRAEQLDVARHPTATFRATSTGSAGGLTRFRGWLTIVGATNEVEVDVDLRGMAVDPSGTPRSVFSGAVSIDRESWGLSWNVTLADGRALVERIVDLEFELEAVRQPTPSAPSTSSDTGRL